MVALIADRGDRERPPPDRLDVGRGPVRGRRAGRGWAPGDRLRTGARRRGRRRSSIGPVSVTAGRARAARHRRRGASSAAAFLAAGRLGFGPLAAAPGPRRLAALARTAGRAASGLAPPRRGLRPAGGLAGRRAARHPDRAVRPVVPAVGVRREPPDRHGLAGRPRPARRSLDLTKAMYNYHNDLPNPHPASSPWWAWTFDLKPVWFYEQGFAGSTSASIYDAGNLVAWWLAVPAMAFVAWQAFRRRSPALALIAIAFAVPVDLLGADRPRGVPVPLLHGAAVRVPGPRLLPGRAVARSLAADLAAGAARRRGVAVLGPFLLWLFHRPLCAVVRVERGQPGLAGLPHADPGGHVSRRGRWRWRSSWASGSCSSCGSSWRSRRRTSRPSRRTPCGGRLARRPGPDRAGRPPRDVGGDRRGHGHRLRPASTPSWPTGGLPDRGNPRRADRARRAARALAGRGVRGHGAGFAPVRARRARWRWASGSCSGTRTSRRCRCPVAIHNAYQGFLPTYLYAVPVLGRATPGRHAPSLFALGPAIMLAGAAVHERRRRLQRLVVADRARGAAPGPPGGPRRAAAGRGATRPSRRAADARSGRHRAPEPGDRSAGSARYPRGRRERRGLAGDGGIGAWKPDGSWPWAARRRITKP